MKRGTLTATTLRLILAASLILIGTLVSLFVANTDRILKDYAKETSELVAKSNAGSDNILTLRKIQEELIVNKKAIERTSDIVADSQSYQYQDQIITDLNDYANRANISVTNIDFLKTDPGTTTAPTTPQTTTPVPTGVKSTSVSITLKNPVEYENLLRFIKSIEQNLTKMQISRVGLSKDPTADGVTSEVLTIEVYIR